MSSSLLREHYRRQADNDPNHGASVDFAQYVELRPDELRLLAKSDDSEVTGWDFARVETDSIVFDLQLQLALIDAAQPHLHLGRFGVPLDVPQRFSDHANQSFRPFVAETRRGVICPKIAGDTGEIYESLEYLGERRT